MQRCSPSFPSGRCWDGGGGQLSELSGPNRKCSRKRCKAVKSCLYVHVCACMSTFVSILFCAHTCGILSQLFGNTVVWVQCCDGLLQQIDSLLIFCCFKT